MLSRLHRTSQVAYAARGAMVSSRGYAKDTKAPKPPTPSTPQPKQTPPTPKQPTPQAASGFAKPPTPASGKALTKHEFYEARQYLPLRLYSRHGILASRLYVLAERQGKAQVDEVAKSLAAFNKELEAHPTLAAFMASPANTPDQKKVLISKLSGPLKISPILNSFFTELADTRKAKLIPKIAKQFADLLNARDKIVHVKLTKAAQDQAQPSEDTVRDVLGYSKDTKVVLSVVVDPKIVGGAILQSKDRYVDKSFRSEITQLKDNLAKEEAKERAEKRAQFMKALQSVESGEYSTSTTATAH